MCLRLRSGKQRTAANSSGSSLPSVVQKLCRGAEDSFASRRKLWADLRWASLKAVLQIHSPAVSTTHRRSFFGETIRRGR